MADLSDYLENELLDHILKGLAFTVPATVALALFTSATGDDGSGTEVPDSNGYARLEVEGGTGRTFSVAAGGTMDNDQEWAFAAASGGAWGLITHVAIVDSLTHGAGNFLFHGALSVSKQIDDGDTFKFAVGDLDVALA
jgi:hypothetical protein